MKIGILETGRPPRGLAAAFGRYPAMFERLIGPAFSYRAYEAEAGELPASAVDADAWLVTGSPAGVYDPLPWIAPLQHFLAGAKGRAKLIGVCFGHQLLAQTFGGRVEQAGAGWGIGLHEYRVLARRPWMDEAETIAIPVSHQDQIVVQPPATTVLAGSEFNRFGVLAYDDQPAISFQCHPEFAPDYAAALIEGRRMRLPKPDEALATLERPNDRERVGNWIRGFLAE